jgi:hypothetical protein
VQCEKKPQMGQMLNYTSDNILLSLLDGKSVPGEEQKETGGIR